MNNIIDLENVINVSDDDITKVFITCRAIAKDLNKEIEELTFENVKRFLEDTGNKREYLLSKYEESYTYVDFAIDTLGSNIRFL